MERYLHLAVGVVIALQWLHLAVRQRHNARVAPSSGEPELQVFGLAIAFLAGAIGWVSALTFGSYADANLLWFALTLAFIGAALRVAAIERIGRGFSWGSAAPDQLMTDGVYRLVKHPLVIGFVLEVAALVACGYVAHPVLIWAIALALTNAWFQIRQEERVLAERFGTVWTGYAKNKII